MIINSDVDTETKYLLFKEQTLDIIKKSAIYLNTREINVFEYLKDDRLIEELTQVKKSLNGLDDTKLDEMIHWLDDEWFSYKLNERMAMLYTLHPF